MCVSCMSSAEAVIINSSGAAAAAWYGLRHLLVPQPRAERRRRADAQAREFARQMGLDPDVVVGPAPKPTERVPAERVPAHR